MRRLIQLACIPLFLAACSSGGDNDGVTPPSNQSIGLVLSPASGTVAAGSSTSTSIVLSRVGYTGVVALRADNVPSGVTAILSSPQLVGSTSTSSLILSVAAGTAAGTSSITVRATGTGVAEASATYALTIGAGATPSITLVAGSSAVSAIQGTTATVPLTITRAGGFTGSVDLTAAGLPTGVTAAFAPASLGAGVTTSTMTLTVAANAAAATSSIVVTAAGTGVTAQTATVALTITAAAQQDFSLTATPAALSLAAGQSGTSAIALTRSGGFTGNVQFSLVGAPAGVTGVFAPNPTNTNASTLTISTTAAVVPGTYNLVVNGQGQLSGSQTPSDRTTALTLTVGAAPGITITPIAGQSLSQGSSSAAIGLVFTRTGGLTGDLTLALEGAPAGVTGVFTPNPATGAGSQLVLTATGAAAPGSYTLVVRATSGAVSGTASFALTVTAVSQGGYALAAVPASLSVVQGQTGTSTINIARTGGFTGAVNFTVTGLPTGATGTFTPAAATGTQSTLGIAVGAATPAGTYTLVVRGQSTGLADVTTNVSLTVTASGGGGGNIAFRFCAANTVPTFFAYRSGTTGPWTAVTPSNNTFNFSLNQSVGQVAFAQPNSNGTQITVLNYAASEFPNVASAQCLTNPATKTLSGVVAGLAAGQTAIVSVGNSSTSVTGAGPFAIANATDGITDLIATRSAVNIATLTQGVDRIIIRRNINPPAGGSLGATIDFGTAEAFAPATASVTVGNLAGGETLQGFTTFQTANGASGSFFNLSLQGTQGSPITMLGVPSALTQAGDFHIASIVASQSAGGSNINTRSIFQYNRDIAARTVNLGAAANAPTYSTVGTSPYARIRVQGNWQAEYGDFMSVVYGQSNQRAWSITTSRAFAGVGAATFDAEIPDLSGVAGFNNSWGLVAGTSTLYSFNVYAGFTGLTAIAEGTQFRVGTRTTTQTP